VSESALSYHQVEVARRLRAGSSPTEVQRELIEEAPGVSEEERAALWLYAWATKRRSLEQVPLPLREWG
jgi:hypothetical protein